MSGLSNAMCPHVLRTSPSLEPQLEDVADLSVELQDEFVCHVIVRVSLSAHARTQFNSDQHGRGGETNVAGRGSTPPPPLIPISTPWEAGGGNHVDRLEQYLVLATEDHEVCMLVLLPV